MRDKEAQKKYEADLREKIRIEEEKLRKEREKIASEKKRAKEEKRKSKKSKRKRKYSEVNFLKSYAIKGLLGKDFYLVQHGKFKIEA